MDFNTCKYRLKEIADIERARPNHIYPSGTVYIQVSATRGQVGMISGDGPIEGKYAVILPRIDVYPPYFKLAIERAVPRFCARYQTTINIQIGDLLCFEVDIHKDIETQITICQILTQCDKAANEEAMIIEKLKELKMIALSKMMI